MFLVAVVNRGAEAAKDAGEKTRPTHRSRQATPCVDMSSGVGRRRGKNGSESLWEWEDGGDGSLDTGSYGHSSAKQKGRARHVSAQTPALHRHTGCCRRHEPWTLSCPKHPCSPALAPHSAAAVPKSQAVSTYLASAAASPSDAKSAPAPLRLSFRDANVSRPTTVLWRASEILWCRSPGSDRRKLAPRRRARKRLTASRLTPDDSLGTLLTPTWPHGLPIGSDCRTDERVKLIAQPRVGRSCSWPSCQAAGCARPGSTHYVLRVAGWFCQSAVLAVTLGSWACLRGSEIQTVGSAQAIGRVCSLKRHSLTILSSQLATPLRRG